ncbi:S8 family serine protease [Natronomonas moolapensis 8.8.11]|uniref:S8 family serine protease n=2 Tax=Natronomonas moolapensis TaxID=416273 RepID=M1XTB9_NATM8|nr:S8 family serine protease [Natronomonas moolapensis 8.8.11]
MVSVPRAPSGRTRRLAVLAVLAVLWSLAVLAATSGALAVAEPTGGGQGVGADANADANANANANTNANAKATGEGVTVAVLDSGIDDGHPDLAGRVTERVDLTGAEPTHPENGTDESGHGTFVAGVLGGSGAASNGDHAGVAPGAALVDVRIMAEDGDADEATVAEGIEYAVSEADADIVLLSLQSVGSEPAVIEERVEWANDRGALVVASAGNRAGPRSVTTPGTARAALTVGAADGAGTVWERSAYGPTRAGAFKPELLAPGVGIVGPRAGYGEGGGESGDEHADPYARRTGTSIAAAKAAGVAALLAESDPDLGPAALERRLTGTARPVAGNENGTAAAGSGVVDADAALAPGVVADGVLDLGVVDDDEAVTRTVTVENRDDRRHDLTFEATLRNAETGERADGAISLHRSDRSLAPGERATIGVRVDGNVSSGVYAGAIRYAVDGQPRSIAVGFVRGGRVTVEKRPLSAGDRVDGDELLVFTEEDTHSEVLAVEDGTASFLAGGGTYVVWSAGVDDASGSVVFLSERLRVDGDTRVVLDEAETVRAGVDATALESRYGPLENRSIAASMVTETAGGTERLSRRVLDADTRTVRVSRDRETAFTARYLLTTETDGAALDAAEVFHLSHHVRWTKWAAPRTVRPDDLETTTYRIGRTTLDRTPEVQERTSVRRTESGRGLSWFPLGDRSLQRVHRTPEIDHDRHLRLEGWRAALSTPSEREVPGWPPNAALSHPFVATADVDIDDGTASVGARPLDDGAGTRLYARGEHAVSVAVDGEIRAERRSDDPTIDVGGVPVGDAESVSVRIDGENPEGRLSTRTRTEVTLRGNDTAGASVPLLRDVRLEDATPTNAAGPGAVPIRIRTAAREAVADATVWHTTGSAETPPWVDASGWERTPAGFGYRGLRATVEAPESAETVSLAVEVDAESGSTVRTMTADAFHVGRAPNTSTRFVEGRLRTADGGAADNDTVIAAPAEGDPVVASTGSNGRFSLEVPKDESYELQYRRGDLFDGGSDESSAPKRPDFYSLGRVEATEDTELNRTLPAPTRFDVRVRDERGVAAENATVRIAHRAGNATSVVELTTDKDGTVALGGTPGLHLAGPVNVTVEAPEESPFVASTLQRTVALDGTVERATERFVLETEPPTAALSTSRTWMLEGTPTTLDASASEVPAGPAEYRWDLDGDGSIDRVTDAPTTRYAPALGETDPSVTVVDAAGKRANATVGPIHVTEEV